MRTIHFAIVLANPEEVKNRKGHKTDRKDAEHLALAKLQKIPGWMVVVDRMRSGKGNCGLDASSGKFVDLIEAGILDATKVVRIALENAVSVASTLLLTEATLTEEREKKPQRVTASEVAE